MIVMTTEHPALRPPAAPHHFSAPAEIPSARFEAVLPPLILKMRTINLRATAILVVSPGSRDPGAILMKVVVVINVRPVGHRHHIVKASALRLKHCPFDLATSMMMMGMTLRSHTDGYVELGSPCYWQFPSDIRTDDGERIFTQHPRIHQILIRPVKPVRVVGILNPKSIVNTTATQFELT